LVSRKTAPARLSKDMSRLVVALGSRSRPEIRWVARVAGCPVQEAEDAVDSIVAEKGLVLELCESIRRTGRTYYAQFPAPIELYALVRLAHPRTLVESGVSSGVSSTFLLLGAKANGRGTLHSIDFPVPVTGPHGSAQWGIPSGLTSGWAIPGRLRGGWDLRQGRSEDLLKPLLSEVGTLDFYCHDSPVDTAHFAFEMKAIGSHLKPGSVVICDNTDKDTFDRAAEAAGTSAHYRRHSSLGAFRVPLAGDSRHR
jgi:Methyltransferase domain